MAAVIFYHKLIALLAMTCRNTANAPTSMCIDLLPFDRSGPYTADWSISSV